MHHKTLLGGHVPHGDGNKNMKYMTYATAGKNGIFGISIKSITYINIIF
jgi:hypothetical protein